MSEEGTLTEAVEILQQLGLKQYEAECFVGLSRMSTGTAKRLSEATDVPRTRVYDAIRVLEEKGLVETQHTSPKRFRAVPLEEATETLRDQYEKRIARLEQSLDAARNIDSTEEGTVQEVWSMNGHAAIANRTDELVGGAESEVVLVVGDESALDEDLVGTLNALEDDVDVMLGAVTDPVREAIREAVPDAETFISGLDWLRSDTDEESVVAISRLLLVDRQAILVSTVVPDSGEEHAIFGEGFGNGLVVISRRLMAQGLVPSKDVRE